VAEYPGQLARTHRLFDGRTVTIRPIRPDDFARERRFLEELSGESRYLRFQMSPARAAPCRLTAARRVRNPTAAIRARA